MPELEDFPGPLAALIAQFRAAINDLILRLETGEINVDEWQREMERLIALYHSAAYMRGQDGPLIGESESGHLYEYIFRQFEFLDNFTLAIQAEGDFRPGWHARARSYAMGIVAPYWKGRTKVLPLPAMPGDMTTPCGQNCACGWVVEVIDEQAGHYDCFWRLNAIREVLTEHCQICIQRAREWQPLQIRDGRIVIPPEVLKDYSPEDRAELRRLEAILEITHKHLPGQHPQKRHGWRYGTYGGVKRTLRRIHHRTPTVEETGAVYGPHAGERWSEHFSVIPTRYWERPEAEEYKRRVRRRAGATREEARQKRIRAWERKNRNQRVERAGVFDEEGRLIFEKQGTASRVEFVWTEIEQLQRITLLEGKPLIFSHNHPSAITSEEGTITQRRGHPLSNADIAFMVDMGATEFRATTAAGWTYVMRAPKGGWSFMSAASAKQHMEHFINVNAVRRVFNEMREGSVLPDEADWFARHYALLDFVKTYGGSYTIERSRTGHYSAAEERQLRRRRRRMVEEGWEWQGPHRGYVPARPIIEASQ